MAANIEYPRGIGFDPFAEPEDEPLCFKDDLDLPGADEKPQVYLLSGRCPGADKSYMLKSMMHIFESRKQFSWGITFGESDQYTWMPTRSVRIYDDEYFKNYITNLRQKQFEGVKIPPNYVVFDDYCGHFTEWQNKFMSTHRQTNTTVFILTQIMAVRSVTSICLRSNVTFALLWPPVHMPVVKGLYEHFGGLLSYEEFEKALRACRKKQYSCLVYKNSPENVTIADQFCTIVAPTFPEGFQLKF